MEKFGCIFSFDGYHIVVNLIFYIPFCANTVEKDMNPSLLHTAMGALVRFTGLFSLDWQQI